jgi:hypothetical protein
MTNEGERVMPEEPDYTAIIRALSSTKKDYLEAFDLLRQMLARHHEATYVPFSEDEERSVSYSLSRWIPTLDTWKALLEGTKRAGDLPRARWVLAESLRLARASEAFGLSAKGPDEDMMASVFMTYAAWQPVFRRGSVKVAREKSDVTGALNTESAVQKTGVEADAQADVDLTNEVSPSPATDGFTGVTPENSDDHSPSSSPQTSAEALHEATELFQQILRPQSSLFRLASNPFRETRLTTRLVNAYLSVHLAHALSLTSARETWEKTWSDPVLAQSGVKPNGWTYLIGLEKCATGNRHLVSKSDREEASSWGPSLWEDYLSWREEASRKLPSDLSNIGLGPRQVERAWRAIIRIHALCEDLPTSFSLLFRFSELHPPSSILRSYTPFPDPGLGIRFSDPTMTREADIPPHLLFGDVEVLYQRLARDEDQKKVKFVTWLTTSYEKALEKRRKWRLSGAGKRRLWWVEARKSVEARQTERRVDEPNAGGESEEA